MYRIIKLDVHSDDRGELVAIENGRNIPFDIKRVFYIFNVGPDVVRARHAQKDTREIIVPLSGTCRLLLDNGRGSRVTMRLEKRDEAVYIDPTVWIELSHFSKDCVLLVLSDVYYSPENQIRDYREFIAQNDTIPEPAESEPAVPF